MIDFGPYVPTDLEIDAHELGQMVPVIIARPGIAASRQNILVRAKVPLGHLKEQGFEFPRIFLSIAYDGTHSILKDDGVGAVPRGSGLE